MTSLTGYSDRINHALAFAEKHHDQLVRRGSQRPYHTRPANVAIILTRYGQDDNAIVTAILHDVVQDSLREGHSRDMLQQRIGDKFGADVLETLVSVTERQLDDDGVEMSPQERREDLLRRLATASHTGLWVCLAHMIHSAGTLLADLHRSSFPETVWQRFGPGRDGTVAWFRRIERRLTDIGFSVPALAEFRSLVGDLERKGAAAHRGGSERDR